MSTRGLLVLIGLVSPALGVIGAMGLLCVCGVKVVEMVWVVPVLVLGEWTPWRLAMLGQYITIKAGSLTQLKFGCEQYMSKETNRQTDV